MKQSTALTLVSLATVATVLAGGVGLVVAVFTVPFMFDAPGSTDDTLLKVLGYSLGMFPFTCFAAIVSSWVCYFNKKYNGAIFCTMLPMVNLIVIGIALCLKLITERVV